MNQREVHVLRDLFRTSSDSESSDCEVSQNNFSDSDGQGCDVSPQDAFLRNVATTSAAKQLSKQIEPRKTVVHTIQHVRLEVCTVGGSIEHRLWPASEFLVSYILQQQHNDSLLQESNRFQSRKNSTIHSGICRNVYALLQRFTNHPSKAQQLKVIELGAGVGYTSLELAHSVLHNAERAPECGVQFLVTDLPSAIPLLQRNVDRNFGGRSALSDTVSSKSSIQVQKLEWGNMEDIDHAIQWYNGSYADGVSVVDTVSSTDPSPLLILGSDCVYWESLYDILETTIATLLQNAASNSICLLANVRRWKRDTHFFQNILGQTSSTANGQLHCVCLHERVTRPVASDKGPDDGVNDGWVEEEEEQRQVLRIYAVQWVAQ